MMIITEDVMREETPITNQASDQAKKDYVKPALNKIRLVAEEAVLAACKNGTQNRCFPNPTCVRTFRS